MNIRVKFYGTRGSTPICGPTYYQFGGNTTCIQITDLELKRTAIIDAGTGIRALGKDILADEDNQDNIIIVFTHFHWDHIQGFPFFAPAYDDARKIYMLVVGKVRQMKNLRDIFAMQMQHVYFPVQLDSMGARFEFLQIDKSDETFELSGGEISVSANRHQHPGGAYGYRIERKGKSIVVCTDIEHGDDIDPNVVALAKGADLLIHDAQYTTEEYEFKKGWGHSTFDQAIRVAEMAGVKQLAITHHDPEHDDDFLLAIEKKCQDRFSDCILARELMELIV